MRSFWGYYDNGTYRVGCNGQSIWVYDQNDRQICRFQDIPYAYCGAFQPGTNVFAAKSTEGFLAFYDLDAKKLLHKIVITRIGAQDDGFAFSPDGNFFYNIESPIISYRSQLTVYRMQDFKAVKSFFVDDKKTEVKEIEWDARTNKCYLLGFLRGRFGSIRRGFIAKWQDEALSEMHMLSTREYDALRSRYDWAVHGFTKKFAAMYSFDAQTEKRFSLREEYEKRS